MVSSNTKRFTETTNGGFEKMKAGVDIAANIICSTLGPHGMTISIADKMMPFTTKDGATVARNIKLEDAWQRMGSDFLIDTALKTEHEAGDSTTTTCAIVQGILNSLPRNFNAREVCAELEDSLLKIEENIKKISRPVMVDNEINRELLKRVATISANNNAEAGELISRLVADIGLGGVIHVQPSGNEHTRTEIKSGYNYKEGVVTPHFLHQGNVPVNIEEPLVLLIEQKITDQALLHPVYAAWKEYFPGRPLVIVASDISGTAIDFMVANFQKGLPAICVKCPGFGQERLEAMQDLKLITGAETIFTEYTGNPIQKFGKFVSKSKEDRQKQIMAYFGQVPRIYTSQRETVVFFDDGEEMRNKIESYCAALDEADIQENQKQFYKERKSKLRNGIGYLYVGASSQTELHNKALQFDDSQMACFSALEDGVMVGGGHSMVLLGKSVGGVMGKALMNPFNILMANSGIKVSWWERLLGKQLEDKYFSAAAVYNVKTRTWEHVEDTYVLDATKAVRCAIRNAVSVSIEAIKAKYLIQWVENK